MNTLAEDSRCIEDHVRIFKAFCDENRLQILALLGRGELCACSIQEALPITQSTLSHHMKILLESGVVSGRKSGKWTYYRLSAEGAQRAQALIGDYCTVKPHLESTNLDLTQSCD